MKTPALFPPYLRAFLGYVLLLATTLLVTVSCITTEGSADFSPASDSPPLAGSVPLDTSAPDAGEKATALLPPPDLPGGSGELSGDPGLFPESADPDSQPVREFTRWLLEQVQFGAGYEPLDREAWASAQVFGYGPRLGVSIVIPESGVGE